MPRPKSLVPKLSLHKASGQAVCYVNRQRMYLGPHGSPEAGRRYAEIVQGVIAGDSIEASKARKPSKPVRRTVNELVLRFAVEKLPQYRPEEKFWQKAATTILVDLSGDVPADDFGPIKLRAVRRAMVEKGWSRSYIDRQIKRLRHIFRWGVGWELVSHSTAEALGTVEGLKAGETAAPDHAPRRAVSDADLKAVRDAFTNERHRDLFDLFLLTGARAGELLGLTTGMIDCSDDKDWRADLAKHKTAHRGRLRALHFNAKAQEILKRYLQADPDARLFTIHVEGACERARELDGDEDGFRAVQDEAHGLRWLRAVAHVATRARLDPEAVGLSRSYGVLDSQELLDALTGELEDRETPIAAILDTPAPARFVELCEEAREIVAERSLPEEIQKQRTRARARRWLAEAGIECREVSTCN